MKKGIELSFLIVGTVIGAGYASGREIWLFFGPNSGRTIFVFSLLFALSCYIILTISFHNQTSDYKPVLQTLAGRKLNKFYDIVMILYLIFTTIIIIAGSGVTFKVYQAPNWIGIGFIVMMLIWAFSYNVDQVITINSIIVPMLLIALFILLMSFLAKQPVTLEIDISEPNYFNAITFTSVNILPIISVLGAVGNKIKSKFEVILASVLSAVVLGVLSWAYNHSLTLIAHEIEWYEMPIYGILIRFSPTVLLMVTIILWLAIFTTAIVSLLGLISRLKLIFKVTQLKLAIILVIIMTPLSFIGFQSLVELVYPVYGFLNLFILFKILIQPFMNRVKS